MNKTMLPWKTLSASLGVGVLTPGWNLAEPPPVGAASRVFSVAVNFASAFAAPPVVQIGLTGFDVDQRDSGRVSLKATKITATGFTAEITTWRDTRVYAVEFGWLAIGA